MTELLKPHSLTLKTNLPKYQAFKGKWTYAIPQEFIDAVMKCEQITEVCRTNFKNNIVAKLRKGLLEIEWRPIKGYDVGRYYSGQFDETGVSCGSISTQIKSIKNSYYKSCGWTDLDFEKCHPSLIVNIVKKSGLDIDVSPLVEYIQDFNNISEKLIQHYSADPKNPLSKRDIKDLFNGLMYGQGFNGWVSNVEQDEPKWEKVGKPVVKIEDDFYIRVKTCVKKFHQDVITANPALKEIIVKVNESKPIERRKSKDAVERSCLSFYLQTFENYCLYHAYNIAYKQKWVEQRRADLCYDGFTAKINADVATILPKLNELLKEKTGFDMTIKDKPLEDVIDELVFEYDHMTHAELDAHAMEHNKEHNSTVRPDWARILTSDYLAKTLLELEGHNMCSSPSGFYVFSDGKWHNETDAKQPCPCLYKYVSVPLYNHIMNIFNNDVKINGSSDYTATIYCRIQKTLLDNAGISNVMKSVRNLVRQVNDIFDKNPNLLGFNNGVIELDTKTFRPYQYDDYITLSCGYDYTPVDLNDPEVVELYSLLNDIIFSIQPNEDARRLFLQTLASALDGNQYQKVFMFCGAGGNGKGLTGSLMRQILGQYAYNPDASVLKDVAKNSSSASPEVFRLKNMRYVNFTEVRGLICCSILRKLTGGDRMSGRALYGNTCEFNLFCTLFMEFNDPPELDGKPEEADYRRMFIMLFPNIFTDDENKIGRTINGKTYMKGNPYYTSEHFRLKIAPMWLDLLLETYKKYYDPVSKRIQFDLTEEGRDDTNNFMLNQNPIRAFITENYVEDASGGLISCKSLWEGYSHSNYYLDLNRQKKRQYAKNALYEYLKSSYEQHTDKKTHIVYVKGLKVMYDEKPEVAFEYADAEE